MNDIDIRKKPTYLLPIAAVVFVLGANASYGSVGFSALLIPAIISYLGFVCLLAELATGNIAIINLREWNKIEIGIYGKLALLLMVIGGLARDLLIN